MKKNDFLFKTREILLSIAERYSQAWENDSTGNRDISEERTCGCKEYVNEHTEDHNGEGKCCGSSCKGNHYEEIGRSLEPYMDTIFELLSVDSLEDGDSLCECDQSVTKNKKNQGFDFIQDFNGDEIREIYRVLVNVYSRSKINGFVQIDSLDREELKKLLKL